MYTYLDGEWIEMQCRLPEVAVRLKWLSKNVKCLTNVKI